VYAQSKQGSAAVTPRCEEGAFPADPEPGYGWEKLYTEQLCRYYRTDFSSCFLLGEISPTGVLSPFAFSEYISEVGRNRWSTAAKLRVDAQLPSRR
jgi:hypothetical protein